jgi:hypothetical protein
MQVNEDPYLHYLVYGLLSIGLIQKRRSWNFEVEVKLARLNIRSGNIFVATYVKNKFLLRKFLYSVKDHDDGLPETTVNFRFGADDEP